uniref:Fibrinogen C-terminal domain-containing protein n=1 Tax=Macrostomum lignano TaxID=282301 RepID=A0A1I8GJL0_9PLAT
ISFSDLSRIECSAAASSDSAVQLVAFNASSGLCAHFRCRLGLSHCRKCCSLNKAAPRGLWRNWTQYQSEFGEGPDGNYWIGLNALHEITQHGSHKVRFLMKAWNGSEHWAEYSSFSVGPESDNYRLSVSGFSAAAPASATASLVEKGSSSPQRTPITTLILVTAQRFFEEP